MPLIMFSIVALAVKLPLLLVTIRAEDQTPFTEAESATRKNVVSYDTQITEDAKSRFGNTDAKKLFVNNPTVGDYFDTIAEAAGFLEVALRGRDQGKWTRKYFDITGAVHEMFKDASSKTDDQAAPLGLRECGLLPEQLRNFSTVPIAGLALNAFTASSSMQSSPSYMIWYYDYDVLQNACATVGVNDSLKTLEALMGENCDKSIGGNGSVEGTMQEEMKQFARENDFESDDDQNRCLHVFVARYTNKSEEAVKKLTLSFDKYYLAFVTIEALCTIFAPNRSKEAHRTKLLTAQTSFAKGLTRLDTMQLDSNKALTCDSKSEELIANASASCDKIKSTVGSMTYLRGNKSAEEYANMAFEMVDAIKRVDNSTSEWLQDASTPRELELRKRTRLRVLGLISDLLKYLAQSYNQLPKPFGLMEDMLWPESVYFKKTYPLLSDTFVYFGRAVANARNTAEAGYNSSIDGRVHWHCEYSDRNETLRRMIEPMKGGCETHVNEGPDKEDEELASDMMWFAMAHGFEGCEDNKCLQIFVARYKNYGKDALAKIKNAVYTNTLLSVIVQSICASSLENTTQKEDMRLRTVNEVRSVKDAMNLLSNLSSKAGIYEPCASALPAWTSKVEAIASSVVDSATSSVNASSWQARQAVHELVAKGIVKKLNASTYYFKALAYLPFSDDGQHGFLRIPIGAEDVLRNESKLVKYVVSRYRKRAVQLLDNLRDKWDTIEKHGNPILDATFSASTSNLAKRVEEVQNRFKKDIGGPFLSSDGFRALVALRCGYEFVWYELGYRYFPAGFTTDGYVLATQQDNRYKYNCGQIIFFP